MGEALQSRSSSVSLAAGLPALDALLIEGGDGRLKLDPRTGLNKYGCPASPSGPTFDFASSTASIISDGAWNAAEAARARLAHDLAVMPSAVAYARELAGVRADLLRLNGLSDLAGLEVIFAASGTDLHLIASALAGGDRDRPLACLTVEPEETGSGVPQALGRRHFSDRAALGAAVAAGEAIGPAGAEFLAVRARTDDGRLRDGASIEAELDALILDASHDGRRALLTVADVSKTGLIAPGLAAVTALRRRFPRTLEVLVDACQFRLSARTLRAYLEAGLMVAITGSKFLTGPTFSGALLIPAACAARLRDRLAPPELSAYCARAEWPEGWVAGASLPAAANFGLAIRWRAALAELETFRALPHERLSAFLADFAEAVETRIAADPVLERLPTRRLDRSEIGAGGEWDAAPTIFAFRLRRSGGGYLDLAETQAIHRRLSQAGLRLGQPVACGDGAALRLCASARLAVQALGEGGQGEGAVIAAALAALDAASAAAR